MLLTLAVISLGQDNNFLKSLGQKHSWIIFHPRVLLQIVYGVHLVVGYVEKCFKNVGNFTLRQGLKIGLFDFEEFDQEFDENKPILKI